MASTNQEITVACVYWQGNFRGREKSYTPQWVAKLQAMVHRHLSLPHQFVCLSNVDVPCKRIPLAHPDKWIGWWSKIELFRPWLFSGRVLYLDLDLVILRGIEHFVEFEAGFAALPAFGKPNKENGTVHGINSSVMVWDAGRLDFLWNEFMARADYYMGKFRGDQDFIAHEIDTVTTFPKSWVTKLRYLRNNKPDPVASIILCMPGKNEVAAKKYKWVEEAWEI